MEKNNTQKSSFLSDIRFSFLLAVGIFSFVFIAASSFAALTKDTLGPDGELTGGAFTYWLREVLVSDSLPVENDLFAISDALEDPTAKKTRRLADETGSQVAIGSDGKLGIGTDSPSEILEIKGDTPRVLVNSPIAPQVYLVDTDKQNGTVFFDTSTQEMVFQKGEEKSLEVNSLGEANAMGAVKENNVQVVKADQKCEQGFFVSGFDTFGNIKCGN